MQIEDTIISAVIVLTALFLLYGRVHTVLLGHQIISHHFSSLDPISLFNRIQTYRLWPFGKEIMGSPKKGTALLQIVDHSCNPDKTS
jgi:hypothetical protein